MKIQCDVCEAAEAALLCCADEAALCWSCDEKVHAANKLAGKHQRVPLLTPDPAAAATAYTSTNTTDQMPTCDICQDKAGYFFCLEDRALLCRNCDVRIHTASPYGSSHRRFLITGVRVALQHYPADNNITFSSNNSTGNDRSNSSNSNNNLIIPQASDSSITNKKPWTTPTNFCVDEREGIKAPWMWNEDYEVFDSAEFGQCYGISEPGSSS